MSNKVIERDIYICEIFRIPYGINEMKKTFVHNGYVLPIGKGFFWILKIANGIYKGREIMDYFPVFFDKRYTQKEIDFKKIINITKQLKLESFRTDKLYELEGKIIPVLIDVRLNKKEERENYVAEYLVKDISDFKKDFY